MQKQSELDLKDQKQRDLDDLKALIEQLEPDVTVRTRRNILLQDRGPGFNRAG